MINVFISYYDTLFNNRDYLFKSKLSAFLDKKEEVFAHVNKYLDTVVTTMRSITSYYISM